MGIHKRYCEPPETMEISEAVLAGVKKGRNIGSYVNAIAMMITIKPGCDLHSRGNVGYDRHSSSACHHMASIISPFSASARAASDHSIVSCGLQYRLYTEKRSIE